MNLGVMSLSFQRTTHQQRYPRQINSRTTNKQKLKEVAVPGEDSHEKKM
jgi:hypothetical protein